MDDILSICICADGMNEEAGTRSLYGCRCYIY